MNSSKYLLISSFVLLLFLSSCTSDLEPFEESTIEKLEKAYETGDSMLLKTITSEKIFDKIRDEIPLNTTYETEVIDIKKRKVDLEPDHVYRPTNNESIVYLNAEVKTRFSENEQGLDSKKSDDFLIIVIMKKKNTGIINEVYN